MSFKVDGVSASLSPYSQRYRNIQTGVDHNGAPLFSRFQEVDLSFDVANVAPKYHIQWLEAVDGASHTLDILTEDFNSFRTVSPVYLTCEQLPDIQEIVSQPFVITVRRVPKQTLSL